jgi:hypothetical protein
MKHFPELGLILRLLRIIVELILKVSEKCQSLEPRATVKVKSHCLGWVARDRR